MSGKRKRRIPHYHTFRFKLSKRQTKSLKNYCKARRTTPNKLIKKAIRRYTECYAQEVPPAYYVTENQLDLFELEESEKKFGNGPN